MIKSRKRIVALLLILSMLLSSADIVVRAAVNVTNSIASAILQPIDIEKLDFTGKRIETARTSKDKTLLEIYNRVKNEAPTLSEDGKKIILPETGNDNYAISLYGSGNKAVIDMDGNVTQPLEDMKVYLYYKVTNVTTQEELHMDDPVCVKVNGMYDDEQKTNDRPQVMPGIREWKGDNGGFSFNGSIVIADETLRDAAEVTKFYIEEMTDTNVDIRVGKAVKGDIFLAYDELLSVGEEGYTMNINKVVEVKAPEYKGIVYAGATIAQILMQSDNLSMPTGMMRDYPQYEVRSTMLDVARFYMPLDYLEEITKYAAFYKQSEIHIHINDDGGEQLTAFRVESKKYPQINSGLNPDEVYSQEDYKAYQKEMKKYGIDVVTEIDTPAHASFVALYDPGLMLPDGYHIDLSKREPIEFMKSLFDEFLDGEDPVFCSNKFNIGTDEYRSGHNEEMRAYMDEMIKYVASKGYETRLWSGLNREGGKYWGTTPITNENAVFHFWSDVYGDIYEHLNGEYVMINNNDSCLYSVPEAGYCNDYLDILNLYRSWQAGVLPGGTHLYPGHPLMIGSEAALWNDMKLGVSEFDIFDRHRDQIMLMAEKNWYGEQTEGQTASDFMKRVEVLGNKAPGVNPARQVVSATEVIAEYDFTAAKDGIVQDLSSNGYDAEVIGLKTSKQGLVLNGKGYVSLPFNTVGYPYTLDFEMYISSATGKNAVMFEGAHGTMYYNYDGTGKIGYERKGYSYLFDYELSENTNYLFSLTCNTPDKDGQLRLYINGEEVATGDYYKVKNFVREESSTFVLPTEKIGGGIHGYLVSMKIKNVVSLTVDQIENNIALGKKTGISGIVGGYLEDGTLKYPQFEPKNATDGNRDTIVGLEQVDNSWFYVDLGGESLINKVVLHFGELPNAYELQISDDGKNWTTVEVRDQLEGSAKSIQTFLFDKAICARYVKYQQIEMFDHPLGYGVYSGNFSEFEVYGIEIKEVLEAAKAALSEVEENDDNAVFRDIMTQNIEKITTAQAGESYDSLIKLLDAIKLQTRNLYNGETEVELTNKDKLGKLLAETVDTSLCSDDSVQVYNNAIRAGEKVYIDVTCSQRDVDNAVKSIKQAKLMLMMMPAVSITTNCMIHETNSEDLVLDGNTQTSFWKHGCQIAGDYIQIDFREPFALTSVRLIADYDLLKYGALHISQDGINFSKIAVLEMQKDQFIRLDKETEVQAIRIVATKNNEETWWRLNEVILNGTSGYPVDKKVLNYELSKEADVSEYTEDLYNIYESEKLLGLSVYEDKSATQSQINSTVEAIRAACDALCFAADKEELSHLIENSRNTIEGKQFTEDSFETYIKALEKGISVLADTAASRTDIKTAIWNINESIFYLEKGGIKIVTQPVSVSVAKGEKAVVFVEATGEGLTYVWYHKNPGNTKFDRSGSQFISQDGKTFSIPIWAWRDGQEVYCVITDEYGNAIQTDTVILSIIEDQDR